MDVDAIHDASSPDQDVTTETDAVADNIDLLDRMSSGGEMVRELLNAGEVLTRIELELAYCSEKLVNLRVLMMHVASGESDCEAFISETEGVLCDSAEKALEFDFLSGILDSEVRELDDFMHTLQTEIFHARNIISSNNCMGDALKNVSDKLHDSEESLKQSIDQVSEIRSQSANFQRILSSFGSDDNRKDEKGAEFAENGNFSNLNAEIKMQTAQQQKHILRMLEKSLARELDLEKKVAESRQLEEDLVLRLRSLEQEAFYMEQEVAGAFDTFFEADNTAEVLMGISKELLGRLQMLQFNLNSSVQRERELKSKLQDYNDQLKAKDGALQKLNKEIHKTRMLEDQKEKLSEAASRAEDAEAKCEFLTNINMELNEELNRLKSTGITPERVASLDKKLRETDILLQQAVAVAEASQEKQNMLCSTIMDMENLIEDLKSKVLKAETRADSAEDKLIILSESNSDLNEELSFLRCKIERLDASIHLAEETKKATAKDICIRSKLIAELIMQLTPEREWLQKQIVLLSKENRVLVQHFRETKKDLRHASVAATRTKDGKEAVVEFSAASFESDMKPKDLPGSEKESGLIDSASKLETVRNVDATQLSFNYIVAAVLFLLLSGFAALLLQ